MKKRGVVLAVAGIFVGVTFGIAVRILAGKIRAEVSQLLSELVQESCECKLAFDSLDIHLFRLSAIARNVRITEGGEEKLTFSRVTASFGLSQVLDRVVSLKELRIREGFADGVGPDSVTFRFIDHLTEPIKPERDRPDRWKLKLQRVVLQSGSFRERFDDSSLVGERLSLAVQRDAQDNFNMNAQIGTLKLVSRDGPFTFGNVNGTVQFRDQKTLFPRLTLSKNGSSVIIDAESFNRERSRVEGRATYDLATRSFGLPDWIRARATATGELSGRLGNPTISGPVTLAPHSDLSIRLSPESRVVFPSAEGNFQFELGNGPPTLTVPELSFVGPQASAQLTRPLKIRGDTLAMEASPSISEVSVGSWVIQNVTGAVTLSGTLDRPVISSQLNIGALRAYGTHLPPLRCGVEYIFDKATVSCQGDDGVGKITIGGSIAEFTADTLSPTLKLNGEIRGLAFNTLLGADFPFTKSLTLLGDIAIGGRADPKDLRLDLGLAALQGSQTVLQGALHVKNGVLDAQSQSTDKKLSLTLKRDLRTPGPTRLALAFARPDLGQIDPRLACVVTEGSFNYNFTPESPTLGTGDLSLRELSLGCSPYSVSLASPFRQAVVDGAVSLNAVRIRDQAQESNVVLDGKISLDSGYALKAAGAFYLESLLPFTPALDNLGGHVTTTCSLVGPLASPTVSGSARLERVSIESESAAVSVTELNGGVEISSSGLAFSKLQGEMNGGSVSLSGRFNPLNVRNSDVSLSFNDIAIDPEPYVSSTWSGNVRLNGTESGGSKLSGAVSINSAELRRNLDVRALVALLTERIFSTQRTNTQSVTLPEIDLDLTLRGDRDILLLTNWAAAELSADVRLSGTLRQPALSGGLTVLSGYLALKDNRFDVTSGQLNFQNGSLEPTVQILAETNVRSPQGDYVLVFLEVKGGLSELKMKLSSEEGLSEREIVRLLTSSASGARLTRANTSELEYAYGALESAPRGDDPLSRSFLGSLTRLDSLTVEPQYDFQTASVVPVIVATKRLSDRIRLFSETTIAGNTSESNIGVLGSVFPWLSLSATLDTFASGRTNAAQVDLTYTVLARQNKFLSISVEGTEGLSSYELLRAIRISESSRLTPAAVIRLESDIAVAYRQAGYFSTTASVTCRASDEHCRDLLIAVREGPQSQLSSVRFSGDSLAGILPPKVLEITGQGEPATQQLLDSTVRELSRALRSEGYIAARITGGYEAHDESTDRDMTLAISLGKPVSFRFTGNAAFSSKELLSTINLLDRRQPFGNNTINILLQNIERRYHESGYLYASIEAKRERLATGRVVYHISIDEGARAYVSRVILPVDDTIRDALEKFPPRARRAILSPRFAIASELEDNVQTIRQLLVDAGHPSPSVQYEIVSGEKSDEIVVAYRIAAGEQERVRSLILGGFPPELSPPPAPVGAVSIPAANRYIQEIIATLMERGFTDPVVTANLDRESHDLHIVVESGERTRVRSVDVRGSTSVARTTLDQAISIQPGDPWDEHLLDRARRQLLRLGLFSRVETIPEDGAVDSPLETLVIRLEERPLESLEIGTGINSEDGLHLFGEAVDRGIFLDGRSFTARIDAYVDENSGEINQGFAALRYSDPNLIAESFRFTEDLRFQRIDIDYQEFDLDRVSATTALYRSFASGTTLSLGHTILQEDLNNVSPGARIGDNDSGIVDLSFLWTTLTYDRRNDLINPTAGFSTSADVRVANRSIGSDAQYVSTTGKLSWLFPFDFLDDQLILASNTALGAAWTYGDSDTIPISQRYYLGGRTTVRGFRENSLGPRGFDGSVIGGDTLALQNVELRYLFNDAISLHGFVDVGSVFLRDDSFSRSGLRESSGFGLRFLSPIGPIGFDLGFPLDERPGEPSVRFHFTIGSSF